MGHLERDGTGPVVVFIMPEKCSHARPILDRWYQITDALTEVEPEVRIFSVVTNGGCSSTVFDPQTAPMNLRYMARWLPMILLVPGPLWDSAMDQVRLDSQIGIDIWYGVQIYNGIKSEIFSRIICRTEPPRYDIKEPASFGRWLQTAITDPDFLQVQHFEQSLTSRLVRCLNF